MIESGVRMSFVRAALIVLGAQLMAFFLNGIFYGDGTGVIPAVCMLILGGTGFLYAKLVHVPQLLFEKPVVFLTAVVTTWVVYTLVLGSILCLASRWSRKELTLGAPRNVP